MKRAIVFGVTGQDGSHLVDLLLEKDYEVLGVSRRCSVDTTERIKHLKNHPRFKLIEGDITDSSSVTNVLSTYEYVDEIYNLAAQSHVGTSFKQPGLTWDVTGKGCMNILQAIVDLKKYESRFYQASSSEMFGAASPPQNENTEFYPRSPYGVAKVYSYWITKNYREAYGLFATNGILFNHESPRRGETFVTRKITRAVARISKGLQSDLFLGNLDARRDWGYAPEYVVAMWKMLQTDVAEDFVVGTCTDVSVRDFVQMSFEHVGLDWEKYVRFDERYLRPTEVDTLVGDASKAEKSLGWKASVQPQELAGLMVDHDIATLEGYVSDKPVGAVWAQAIE
jgi:GDPmannose 4,6-dehydratase